MGHINVKKDDNHFFETAEPAAFFVETDGSKEASNLTMDRATTTAKTKEANDGN